MKRKTAADLILMLVCMLLAALLLTPTQARATSKPDPAPISTSSAQQANTRRKPSSRPSTFP